ncbi:DUF6531 domain-containing protein [Teredinibacter turnerae]|uniref:DUF6531 domain-containing protein n=1 Tax=Teredinibacter turnerae TaxID=2426 RepID=UPI00035C405C|nr:DUF6531 domain-containing protein [Teredinibacter turnerae]
MSLKNILSACVFFFGVLCSLTVNSGAIGDTFGNEHVGPNSCLNKGNPINIATGNKYQEFRVYEDAGEFPLEFKWYYNSRVEVDGNYMGRWTHTYGDYAYIEDLDLNSHAPELFRKNKVKILLDNGAERIFYFDDIDVNSDDIPYESLPNDRYRTGFFRPLSELDGNKVRPHINASRDKISITFRFICVNTTNTKCGVMNVESLRYANSSGIVKEFKASSRSVPDKGSVRVFTLAGVSNSNGVSHTIERTERNSGRTGYIVSDVVVSHSGGKQLVLNNVSETIRGAGLFPYWFDSVGEIGVSGYNLNWGFEYVNASENAVPLLEKIKVTGPLSGGRSLSVSLYTQKQLATKKLLPRIGLFPLH